MYGVYTVYGLHGPDLKVVYVGHTRLDPDKRFRNHLRGTRLRHVKEWVDSTAQVTMATLATCETDIEARRLEQWWIDQLQPILNHKR